MGVSTAPVPASIIEKGILADNFVVETVLKKFEDPQPLYRQAVGIQLDAHLPKARWAVRVPMRSSSGSVWSVTRLWETGWWR
jgi:hypothetical protein